MRYDIDLRIFVFERNGVGHDVRIDVERMSLCNHRITRYTHHRLHKLHKVGDPLVVMVHRVRVARIRHQSCRHTAERVLVDSNPVLAQIRTGARKIIAHLTHIFIMSELLPVICACCLYASLRERLERSVPSRAWHAQVPQFLLRRAASASIRE